VGQRFESFVCIDEAQDLAVTEYKLLRNILGKQCVFNLYGDFNQLVYRYKGVRNWVDISDCISDKVYFLNENYRNSTQITNYCNDAFESDVIAIGISGDDVVETTLDVAVSHMLEQKKNKASIRAAIVYKKGVIGLEEIVRKQIPESLLSFNELDTHKISVITAEMAKGL
jgi:superfamily I DNA/RNA helicase